MKELISLPNKPIINIAIDCETTGFTPIQSEMISIGMHVFDDKYEVLDSFYEECSVGKDRYTKNLLGHNIDLWPDGPTEVHGISFEKQKSFQSPLDMYRKMWVFLNQFDEYNFNMVFHAVGNFDLQFLFYRSNLYAPILYQYLNKKTHLYNHEDINDDKAIGCSHSIRHDNTMKMARKYIKDGKNGLKEAEKAQKAIDKNMGYLSKNRKTPATPIQLEKWNRDLANAETDLALANTADVILSGYGLGKICQSLGLKLTHHDASSDSFVLIEIHKFLSQHV
jgi:hypothetical protein